jgi:hypothetical protein
MFMRRLREISDRRSGMGTTLKGVLMTTELEAPSLSLVCTIQAKLLSTIWVLAPSVS